MSGVPALALVIAVGACGAQAQRSMVGSVAHAPSAAGHGSFTPGHRTTVRIVGGTGFAHRPFRRNFGLYGWPYFADYGYDSDEYDYPPPERQEPAPQPAPAAQTNEPIPNPVLLELHGDQWVQVGSFATTSNGAKAANASSPQAPAKEPPPAVLVYRDGHSEELTSYSIIGPVIYTKADYWSSGNWTRKIQIADLDLPATLKQNQERGVKFELPSSPSEIMLRP